MTKSLTISELCKRTGLTSRTLRLYDAKGLVVAERTAGDQRCYGPTEVARLHQVTALKRAGFSLAQIGGILGGRRLDLGKLIAAQLDALDVERERIDEAAAALRLARDRLAAGQTVDVDTFCTLIKQGERMMSEVEAWKKVTDQYVSPGNKPDWDKSYPEMAAGFNQEDYSAKWRDLGQRIEAALPLDPASEPARAFLAEWKALLEPFTRVATPGMMADSRKLYSNMDSWAAEPGAPEPPFTSRVWQFMNEVGAAAKA